MSFPEGCEGINEVRSGGSNRVAKLSLKHDKTVTPYKNSKRNIKKTTASEKAFACVYLKESDTGPMKAWEEWVAESLEVTWQALLPLLEKNGAFAFPCRFPESGASDRYVAFFEAMARAP